MMASRPIRVLLVLGGSAAIASASHPLSSRDENDVTSNQRPNIVFLIDESTDGRTYRPSFEAIDLVNIRRLFSNDDDALKKSSTKDTETPTTTSQPATTVQFDTHYVTAPVCAASRASIWSGKYPHQIPHLQKNTGMPVRGAWNNFEGLPTDYPDKIHDVLEREAGYEVRTSGKTDWVTGGHSLDNRLSAWTMYTSFPYNTSGDQAGFYTEYGMCTGNGTIRPQTTPHRGGYYSGDWKALNETTAWIQDRGREQNRARRAGEPWKPFFAYQGMNIVHPAYWTSSYWYNQVNHSAVTAPEWQPLEDLHPCDFQATMLKGCLPRNSSEAPSVYALDRRKRIRSIYYAMILEFDSMVGAYIDALESVEGLMENTVFVLTSDHGDMQMEHQQFYKHVAYDASSRVPLIVRVPGSALPAVGGSGKFEDRGSSSFAKKEPETSRMMDFVKVNPFVTQPTSHVDLFPTIMDLARVPPNLRPRELHGESLLPFLVPQARPQSASGEPMPFAESSRRLQNATIATPSGALSDTDAEADAGRDAPIPRKRPFVVNQFHGCDIAMSWFSIVDENQYKYNVFGTGKEHNPQLFDLQKDPDERCDLSGDPQHAGTLQRLDGLLRSVVDYPAIAQDVAEYTHASLGAWVKSHKNWKSIVRDRRWKASFDIDVNASLAAIESYLATPPRVYKCRSEPVWPPNLPES